MASLLSAYVGFFKDIGETLLMTAVTLILVKSFDVKCLEA